MNTTNRSEFEGSVKIFSVLIGVALLLKIIIQLSQSSQLNLDPSIPTQDNPTGTNTSKINGQADSTIATYGWCLFWLICMWVTIVSVLSRRYLSQTVTKEMNVIFYSAPFLFAIALAIWTIFQTHTYSRKINTNQVPSTYLGFSVGSTVMLGFMFSILYALSNKLLTCAKSEEGMTIILAWVALALGMVTAGMVLWTEVLLSSYTTDG